MNIKEMEETGTIDYYLDLKKYINNFVNNNYPLSQEDLRSILENNPTENVIQRQETYRILNEAMEELLTNVANRNTEIINGANEGNYTQFSTDDFEQEIFQMKQEMLEKLWEAQHGEEQLQNEESEQTTEQEESFEEQSNVMEEQGYVQESESVQVEQNGEQLVEEVVEQSEEIEIRADEISEANIEINQAEIDFVQEQQPQPNIEMSIGE